MKNILLFVIMSLTLLPAKADITFKFGGGIYNSSLKAKMEHNISVLLTEIHKAGQSNRPLNLSAVSMEQTAKNRLNALWEMLPFICEDQENVSRCLNDYQGYQVRGINITMKPKDNTYSQSIHRELTISLNKQGIITGVRPAYENQEDVQKILGTGTDVADLTKRREILKWVEDFRCYYNEKNINALRQIYSDDALIITGSVTLSKHTGDYGNQLSSNVKYTVQSKTEYINKLSRIFNTSKYINVKFDNISVIKHGAKPNIYGVTLKQNWNTSGYSDEGWLFLLWDFNDPERPQIHVRTWQPDQIVQEHGVFTLDDFFIP